jgi:O-antigen/teichoic acid export membrane protein
MPEADGARFAARVARVAAAAAIVLGLLVAAVAPWAFPWLFGPAYAASTAPAWLLLPGAVALTPYLVLSRWFQAVDRQQVNVGALLGSVALNLGLNLWWIPTHGLLGAAGASLLSYGLQGTILAVAFLRTSGLPHTELWRLRASDLRREAA